MRISYKLHVFFLIVFCWISFLPALSIQQEPNDVSNLNHFKLRAGTSLTLAFMMDYDLSLKSKGRNLSDQERGGINQFSALNDSISNNGLTRDKIIHFLNDSKKGWSKDGPIVFKEYDDQLSGLTYAVLDLGKIVTYNPKNFGNRSNQFPSHNRDSVLNVLSDTWIHDYAQKKDDSSSTITTDQKPNDSNLQTTNNGEYASFFSLRKSSFWWQVSLVIAVFLLIFMIWKNRRLRKTIKSLKKNLKSRSSNYLHRDTQKIQQEINLLKKQVSEEKAKNDRLDDLLRKAQNKKEEYSKEKNVQDNSVGQTGPQEPVNTIAKEHQTHEWDSEDINPPADSPVKYFFISAPIADKKFAKTEIENQEGKESFYRFEDKHKGEFGINTEGKIDFEVLLNSPDFYLLKACEYENKVTADHTKIINEEHGEFKIEADIVEITKKAKIKFL